MNKLQMPDDEAGSLKKLYSSAQNIHAINRLSKGNTITISSQTILFGLILGLIIVSSLILSIRSEMNSSQTQQIQSNLIDQFKKLEEQVQKQNASTQSNDQNKQYQELQKLIMANTFQIQAQNDDISNLKDKQQNIQQLLIDVAVLKSDISKLVITSPSQTNPNTNASIDLIELKINLSMQVKLDYFNSQIEKVKEELSLIRQSIISLPIMITEFQEHKTQFAISQNEIQRLQSDLSPILVQIAQLAPMNVEIINIKKNILDQQTSLDDIIKKVSSAQVNTGSTSPTNQSTTSGSNGSTTTEPLTTPTPTSSSSQTDNSLYLTKIYGPYTTPLVDQKLFIFSNELMNVTTNTNCIITVSKRAIITLTTTGLGLCIGQQCFLTFKMNGNINLPLTSQKNLPFGVASYYDIWHPINFTQEFIVEAGTYEFTAAVGYIKSSNIEINLYGFSFVVKVTYSFLQQIKIWQYLENIKLNISLTFLEKEKYNDALLILLPSDHVEFNFN